MRFMPTMQNVICCAQCEMLRQGLRLRNVCGLRRFSGKSTSKKLFESLEQSISPDDPSDQEISEMVKDLKETLEKLDKRTEGIVEEEYLSSMLFQEKIAAKEEQKEYIRSTKGARRKGSIAIIGTPNSGKSTLMNALVGEHISAVSPKMNTTATATLGVLTEDNIQLQFLDTPGIIPISRSKVPNKIYTSESWNAISGSNAGVVIMDAARTFSQYDYYLFQRILKMELPPDFKLCLALNKIDRVSPKRLLLPLAQKLHDLINFDEIFMISAAENDGVEDLKKYLLHECTVEGDWEVPEGQVTDLSVEERIEECVKEALYQRFNQELPYTLGIHVDSIRDHYKDPKMVLVDCKILVENNRHRGYIIGAEGSSLKQIIAHATPNIESFLKRPVFLQMNVVLAYNE